MPKQSLEPEERAFGAPIAKATDGLVIGQNIPGSKLRRGVCYQCGEPIRVHSPSLADLCSDCGMGSGKVAIPLSWYAEG